MNANQITGVMQRVDECGVFNDQERAILHRALLMFTAPSHSASMAEAQKWEREQVMLTVRRMVQSSHYMRIERAVNDDVRRRTP